MMISSPLRIGLKSLSLSLSSATLTSSTCLDTVFRHPFPWWAMLVCAIKSSKRPNLVKHLEQPNGSGSR